MEHKITITDADGNRKIIAGTLSGFVLKTPVKQGKAAKIAGLDGSWCKKKVLCVLLEGNGDLPLFYMEDKPTESTGRFIP
ncbi:MAG TPA: hypothetical protein VMY59_09855 [Candidatus Thermoplasmatota archaeon]|nr:hypothetical protein [Candidatus Thermoplasmatota archaeon]